MLGDVLVFVPQGLYPHLTSFDEMSELQYLLLDETEQIILFWREKDLQFQNILPQFITLIENSCDDSKTFFLQFFILNKDERGQYFWDDGSLGVIQPDRGLIQSVHEHCINVVELGVILVFNVILELSSFLLGKS